MKFTIFAVQLLCLLSYSFSWIFGRSGRSQCLNCKSIKLDADRDSLKIVGSCKTKQKKYATTELDLNKYIGVDGQKLTWKDNGNCAVSCKRCTLDTNNFDMKCFCADPANPTDMKKSTLRLDFIKCNTNGKFFYKKTK
jgi:hypothetical protein